MWNPIVDVPGAVAIRALGRWYMIRDRQSLIEASTRRFIARNPHRSRTAR